MDRFREDPIGQGKINHTYNVVKGQEKLRQELEGLPEDKSKLLEKNGSASKNEPNNDDKRVNYTKNEKSSFKGKNSKNGNSDEIHSSHDEEIIESNNHINEKLKMNDENINLYKNIIKEHRNAKKNREFYSIHQDAYLKSMLNRNKILRRIITIDEKIGELNKDIRRFSDASPEIEAPTTGPHLAQERTKLERQRAPWLFMRQSLEKSYQKLAGDMGVLSRQLSDERRYIGFVAQDINVTEQVDKPLPPLLVENDTYKKLNEIKKNYYEQFVSYASERDKFSKDLRKLYTGYRLLLARPDLGGRRTEEEQGESSFDVTNKQEKNMQNLFKYYKILIRCEDYKTSLQVENERAMIEVINLREEIHNLSIVISFLESV